MSNILILGAGMAGLATAYQLAVKHGVKNITLVDERPPLGLTSSRGTMAYRNLFPGPGDAMVRLMNRSIELFQQIDIETRHAIQLSQNGYMYLTARPEQVENWRTIATDAQARGVGIFREHSGAVATRDTQPDGTDLYTNPTAIHQLYPQLAPDVSALLHVRRCGALDVIRLGDWLLEQSISQGVQFIQTRVDSIATNSNRITNVLFANGTRIATDTLVIAAGPLLPSIARMLDLKLPVYNELHAKMTMRDSEHVFPRYADLLLWNDPQTLEWTEKERAEISASAQTHWLLEEFPAGVHFLPKGTDDDPKIMGLWTYDIHPSEFVPAPTFPAQSAEIILRGLARMIPAAKVYFGRGQEAFVDGGYYCKTRENRPLIGPLPIQGAYIMGALSGYGIMASQGAAELLCAHILGTPLPDYAKWFLLSRYQDPTYQALLDNWDARSGQL